MSFTPRGLRQHDELHYRTIRARRAPDRWEERGLSRLPDCDAQQRAVEGLAENDNLLEQSLSMQRRLKDRYGQPNAVYRYTILRRYFFTIATIDKLTAFN